MCARQACQVVNKRLAVIATAVRSVATATPYAATPPTAVCSDAQSALHADSANAAANQCAASNSDPAQSHTARSVLLPLSTHTQQKASNPQRKAQGEKIPSPPVCRLHRHHLQPLLPPPPRSSHRLPARTATAAARNTTVQLQVLDCEFVGQRSYSLADSHVVVAHLFVSAQVALRFFAGTACLLSLPPLFDCVGDADAAPSAVLIASLRTPHTLPPPNSAPQDEHAAVLPVPLPSPRLSRSPSTSVGVCAERDHRPASAASQWRQNAADRTICLAQT